MVEGDSRPVKKCRRYYGAVIPELGHSTEGCLDQDLDLPIKGAVQAPHASVLKVEIADRWLPPAVEYSISVQPPKLPRCGPFAPVWRPGHPRRLPFIKPIRPIPLLVNAPAETGSFQPICHASTAASL